MADDSPIPELDTPAVKELPIEGGLGNPKPQMKHLIDSAIQFNTELNASRMRAKVRELTIRPETK